MQGVALLASTASCKQSCPTEAAEASRGASNLKVPTCTGSDILQENGNCKTATAHRSGRTPTEEGKGEHVLLCEGATVHLASALHAELVVIDLLQVGTRAVIPQWTHAKPPKSPCEQRNFTS